MRVGGKGFAGRRQRAPDQAQTKVCELRGRSCSNRATCVRNATCRYRRIPVEWLRRRGATRVLHFCDQRAHGICAAVCSRGERLVLTKRALTVKVTVLSRRRACSCVWYAGRVCVISARASREMSTRSRQYEYFVDSGCENCLSFLQGCVAARYRFIAVGTPCMWQESSRRRGATLDLHISCHCVSRWCTDGAPPFSQDFVQSFWSPGCADPSHLSSRSLFSAFTKMKNLL